MWINILVSILHQMSDYFGGLELWEFIELFWMDLGSEEIVNLSVLFLFFWRGGKGEVWGGGGGFVQSTTPGLCWKPGFTSQCHHTDFFRGSKISVKSCGKAYCFSPFQHLWPFKMTLNGWAEGCWHIQCLLWLDKPALCIAAACFVGFFKGAVWCWSDLLSDRSGPNGDASVSRG